MTKSDETLELLHLMVSTATANEQRRQQISSVFLTLIAGGFAAVGAIEKLELIYVSIPASIVCAVWWLQVRYLKRLATAKFHVIGQLEERLEYRPFAEEWAFLKRDKNSIRIFRGLGLSQLEMIVPAILFLAAISHVFFVAYVYVKTLICVG